MWLERVRRWLLPGDIEQDPGFRQEIHRLSHIGVQVAGGVEIGVSVFMVLAHLLLDPNPELDAYRLRLGLSLVTVGAVTLVAARIKALSEFGRLIGSLSGLLTSAILMLMMLLMTQFDPTADDSIPGDVTLVTLVAVSAIPLRPADTLLFGFTLESTYVLLALGAQELLNVGPGVNPVFVLFIFMLTCLATALTAVLYNQRRSSYEWHLRSLQASENLRQAEARNLLAENAASVGRLAAALSHELNSPIGALVSGVDTLLLLASRQATADQAGQQRMVVLQNEIRKSIRQSTERLRQIVARMQRFTNLDRAEVQAANLNDILADVAALVQPGFKDRAELELKLETLPELTCRPQQLSAVFSNLIGNALEATNGSGKVRVCTHRNNGAVEVVIEDNGRGLDPEELATIFDPEFRVAQGRVTSGNWSMFSARQIVREHGGDIRLESNKGTGTRVLVSIPVGKPSATQAEGSSESHPARRS